MKITAEDALLVIDVQNDFCEGGALAVPRGAEVVAVANRLMARVPRVVVTQDWHPPGHRSFASSHPGRRPMDVVSAPYGEQVLWPDHCVQGSRGAELHVDLDVRRAHLVLRKGVDPAVDSYSAFFENDRTTSTGLRGYLWDQGVRRVLLVGLAFDVCVMYSAIDARRAGFEALVVVDGCRALDVDGSLARAEAELDATGVARADLADLDLTPPGAAPRGRSGPEGVAR